MNILVTGGLGGVGRAVVARLVDHGHRVRIFDRVAAAEPQDVECVAGDLTDYAAVRDSVRGMDAVVHLAALTYPAAAPANDIYRINVMGTFNVYDAAAQEGIRRVVSASSINALGYNFGVRGFPIQYLPLDEDHPSFTTDVYSFSKENVEAIGQYFWRRDGISGVQLRLPFVYSAMPGVRERIMRFSAGARELIADLAMRPESELRELAQRALALRVELRAGRFTERPMDQWPKTLMPGAQPGQIDPAMVLGGGFTDFWAAIGADDTAQAFEKAVTAAYDGSHPLYVCEAENSNGLPSALLARLFFADSALKQPLTGSVSLVSYQRAAALIKFAPTGSLRAWLSDDPA